MSLSGCENDRADAQLGIAQSVINMLPFCLLYALEVLRWSTPKRHNHDADTQHVTKIQVRGKSTCFNSTGSLKSELICNSLGEFSPGLAAPRTRSHKLHRCGCESPDHFGQPQHFVLCVFLQRKPHPGLMSNPRCLD